MENKMLDINDKVIKIYLKGEKSQSMADKYNDFKRKPKENEIKDTIKNILEESSMCKPINEINENLNQINDLIDKNIEDIKVFQTDSIDLIEDYGEFFNLNLIIEEFDLSSPLNLSKVIATIRKLIRTTVDNKILEKCFYLCQICSFLYYEEFIEFYLRIKEKIHQSGIQKTFLFNEAKNNLIKEAKKKLELSSLDEKLIDNVWKN